jgi:hypothetical protein
VKGLGNKRILPKVTCEPTRTMTLRDATEGHAVQVQGSESTPDVFEVSYLQNNDGTIVPTTTANNDSRRRHDVHGDNSSNNNTDDNDEAEHVRVWKESPFAVGLTKPTWREERCCPSVFTPLSVTAFFCRCTQRVGNMVVLLTRSEPYTQDDPVSGHNARTTSRPRILLAVGPYWSVFAFLTLPIITLVSLFTATAKVQHQSTGIVIAWSVCTGAAYASLLAVSFRDPGILYRHTQPPPGAESSTGNWTWNDQALTYRPLHAKYDPECGAVIENFDHTCPWTGR